MPGPFSFDRATLAGARAAVSERSPVPPVPRRSAPAAPPADLTLDELRRFLRHPVRAFLRGRLEVATPFEPDEIDDALPVELDALQRWQIGDRLLREVLAADDPDTAAPAVMLAEQLRGSLPPFELGRRALTGVVQECSALFARSAELRAAPARSIDVDVDLGGGRRLTGTVPRVHGTQVVSLSYSRLGAKQRLDSWVDVLALTATDPDRNWTGHAVAKAKAGPQRALVGPLDHRAHGWLADLVALHDEGMRRPLPLPVKTALAWARRPPQAAARHGRRTRRRRRLGVDHRSLPPPRHRRRGRRPLHRRVFGPGAPVEVLLAAGMGELALRVWEPLLTGAERGGAL